MAATRRSAEEVARLLEGYRQSGMTRTAYCRQQGIPVTSLDYYVRRSGKAKPRLARVTVTEALPTSSTGCFTLTLRNGRRIEAGWNFQDADLGRLIRVAETV